MQVIAIAAVARNGVIGNSGDIPWSLPEDWRRFRRVTTGHVLVMGRTTYEGIGRPLPGRISVVVTHNPAWTPGGAPESVAPGRWRFGPDTLVVRAATITEALDAARDLAPNSICWIAGGGEIYRAAMPHVTALDITEVPLEPDGDTRFPVIDPGSWQVIEREQHPGFTVAHYARVPPAGDPRGTSDAQDAEVRGPLAG